MCSLIKHISLLFSYILLLLPQQIKMTTSEKPKIIIIGAGPAGIGAASKLFDNGFTDLIILEAENRIGGRVYSTEFAGGLIDLGGEWVHGEKGNVVYELVKDLDLLSKSFNDYTDFTYFISNGTSANKEITDKIFAIAKNVLDDEELAKKNPGLLEDFFLKFFNKRIVEKFGNDAVALKLAKYVQDWVHKFVSGVESFSSWNLISTTGFFNSESCEGYQYWNWRTAGYKTVLDVLMKKLPNSTSSSLEDKILLNKEVNEIIWNNKTSLIVKCSDNSTFQGNHIILTVSAGVLKNNYQTIFSPRLPAEKEKAISSFSMGVTNKILLKFPKKWWPDNLKGFSLLWTDEDSKKLIKEFPYGPQIDGKSWLEFIYGFYVIDGFPNVLLGWMTGPLSKDVELLSDKIVVDGCMFLLNKFFNKTYEISKPEEVLRSKWYSNPHFCGSYTYTGVEQEKANITIEDLAEPVRDGDGKDVILFAGEGTSSAHHSTVHGAVESGFREAQRILNMYK